ncbi:MAG: NAD-dependent deacetylase [Verrucomicrobiaceae bacterium]|nr:MAG: NAD-dependent deacetylase [Verrucomicrobiaceae bacterium]
MIIFTGAGISADSGISTFRDANGLWEKHDIDQVCNFQTWKQNFDLVHAFYSARRVQLGTVQPNPAHEMIARLQARYGAVIITQNIDDLLERAGCKDVIHVHGFLTEIRCTNTGCNKTWDIGYTAWDSKSQRCGSCLSLRGPKPNVVFFGESAPRYAIMQQLFASLGQEDVLLVMGTSGNVVDIGTVASYVPAQTILSNLETDKGGDVFGPVLDDAHFNHVLHGRAAERAIDIERLVETLLT